MDEKDKFDGTEKIEEEEEKPDVSNIDFTNVGRNDLCPCGSGKKYKQCCGRKPV